MQTNFTSQDGSESSYSTPIRAGNHVVGKVEGDTFYKIVRGSRHFLRVPPAISFNIESLEEAEKSGASSVEVLDQETGKKYSVPIWYIWHCGFKVNRGFGSQIALPISKWHIVGEFIQMELL